jgi:undecaprenyl-diphosphatase
VSWFEAILLGIVQGLTEFLPISSTGHVRVIPALAGWPDPGAAFSAVIQLGTMAAVLIYFRRDVIQITSAWVRGLFNAEVRRTRDSIMGWYIAVGTVPVVIFGYAFRHQIHDGARSLMIVAFALIVGGIIMLAVDRISTRERGIESVGWKDAIVVGLCQALALIPGTSRSGATIVGGLVLGFDRETAARFSFLLSIPAVVLSGLFELKDVGSGDGTPIVATIIATIFAFIFGYLTIAFLLRYLARHTLAIFGVYRILFGLLIVGLVLTDTIS